MRMVLVILGLGLFGSVFAQQPAKSAPAKPAPPKVVISKDSPTGSSITEQQVKEFTDSILSGLDADLNAYNKASYMRYLSFKSKLNGWRNYQFLESDTKIAADWFKKVGDFVDFFYTTKRENDLSSLPATAKTRADNKTKFEEGVRRFKILAEKPVAANPQRIAVLKQQQQEYLRAKAAADKSKKRLIDN